MGDRTGIVLSCAVIAVVLLAAFLGSAVLAGVWGNIFIDIVQR